MKKLKKKIANFAIYFENWTFTQFINHDFNYIYIYFNKNFEFFEFILNLNL